MTAADQAQPYEHENHRSNRSGWLRAAVLGANDGLISTASLLMGVAAANESRNTLIVTGLAAMAAGAFSMAAGEYGSVATQRDAERADIAQESAAIAKYPEAEETELRRLYEKRGFPPQLASEIAAHLHANDPVAAHVREELGLNPDVLANPIQAAYTSALSFVAGSLLPVLCMFLGTAALRKTAIVVSTLVVLGVIGAISAQLGGASKQRAVIRLLALGAGSLAITALIGSVIGKAL
jgi:vacuolar iron transporter family protein